MTTYSNRSNCVRAAKKSGLEKFSIIAVGDKFCFEDATPVAAKAPKVAKAKREAKAPAKSRKVASKAPGGKTTQLIEMITRGATASELQKALGWLPHTTRGAISRLGKDWGYNITRTKVGTADEGFESHYKIASKRVTTTIQMRAGATGARRSFLKGEDIIVFAILRRRCSCHR